MDARQLRAKRAGKGIAKIRQRGIAHETAALCRASDQALNGERRADQCRIGRYHDRLGNQHAGFVRSLDSTKFGDAVETDAETGSCVRAQNPVMRAGTWATIHRDIDAPVLLDGAAGEQFGGRDFGTRRANFLRQPRLEEVEAALIERAGAAFWGVRSRSSRSLRFHCLP